ncbi:MAG: VWA domain-containing protein [Gammaproteobacteria bacterium]|nr:VWA domain-containing protein [Gammaproteobacteria bacterium]
MRQLLLWSLLVVVSLLVHATISARVGRELLDTTATGAAREIRLLVAPVTPAPDMEIEPEPVEMLEFEQPIELTPPETLVVPKALAPPPPDVPVALRASAGGQGSVAPASPAGSMAALAEGTGGGTAGIGHGIGNGLDYSSNRFAAYVQGLREAGLDVVFVVDATGSMVWVLDEVKSRIGDIVDTVRALVPIARFGVVAYRDKDDPEFVTRAQPLTFSQRKLGRFLTGLEAKGGGTLPEAVLAGLRTAVEDSGWRAGAKRIVILLGDAPPYDHDLDAVQATAASFARAGGQITTLDVSQEANPDLTEARIGRKVDRALYRNEPMYQFRLIAESGSGDASTLDGDIRVTRRLITLIMGTQFAAEMSALLDAI